MRITSFILSVIGSLIALALAAKWLSDYQHAKALVEAAKSLGSDTTKLDRVVRAAYALIGSGVLGIVAGVFVMKRKGKPAALLLAVAAVVPALLAMQTLLAGAFLGLALIFALLVKPVAAA